jgi:predicted permease
MLQDLRFAWRRLRQAPGFALVAVLTLAVAVGANTAVLSIADAVLFRPLPFRDPDRVFVLRMMNAKGQRFTNVTNDYLDAIDANHRGLGEVGRAGDPPAGRVDGPEGVEVVPALGVTAAYLRVLTPELASGRIFDDADTPGRAALLSSASWRTRFGSDPAIVGKTITLGQASFDVVGVLAPGVFLPTSFNRKPELVTLVPPVSPGARGGQFHPIVRLEPGVTREQAQAEIAALVAPIGARDPRRAGSMPVLDDIRSVVYPVARNITSFILAAALLVLLIGCANLANMLLARGRRLERETAVRTALGAGRLRVVRPLLFEALIIGVAAAGLAVAVTRLSFAALIDQVPRAAYGSAAVGVDRRVMALALALAILGGLVFAVVPAWRAARLDVIALLHSRQRRTRSAARVGRPWWPCRSRSRSRSCSAPWLRRAASSTSCACRSGSVRTASSRFPCRRCSTTTSRRSTGRSSNDSGDFRTSSPSEAREGRRFRAFNAGRRFLTLPVIARSPASCTPLRVTLRRSASICAAADRSVGTTPWFRAAR